MSLSLVAGAQLLADSDSDDKGRGSPVGLFVVLILCIAVYFLWKSLNRHIRKIPPSFDPPDPTGAEFTSSGVTTAGHDSALRTDPPVPGEEPAKPTSA